MGRPRKIVSEPKEPFKPITVKEIKETKREVNHFTEPVRNFPKEEVKEVITSPVIVSENKEGEISMQPIEPVALPEPVISKEDVQKARDDAIKSTRAECARSFEFKKPSILYKVKTGATIGVEKIALGMGELMAAMGAIYLFKDRLDALLLLALASVFIAGIFMIYGWMIRDIQMKEITKQLDVYWAESGVASI